MYISALVDGYPTVGVRLLPQVFHPNFVRTCPRRPSLLQKQSTMSVPVRWNSFLIMIPSDSTSWKCECYY